MTLRIREATLADVPGMTQTGLRAMENDEINIALFPPSPDSPDRHLADRTRHRNHMVTDRMLKPGRISMIVVDDENDGRVAGFAQWIKPAPPEGQEPDAPPLTKEELAAANLDIAENPPALDQQKLRDFLDAQKAEEKRVLGEEGIKNLWCKWCCFSVRPRIYSHYTDLIFLGVDPAYQGRGVGKMLVRWGMEQARTQGKGLYLSATPAGKPFYSRLGLDDVGGFEIWGIPQTSFVLRG
jgi:GNAT superfamily N-acetyltransferase